MLRSRFRMLGLIGLSLAVLIPDAQGAEWGLKEGTVELKSAGPLAFGPDGIILVGDTKAATIYAIDTKDAEGSPSRRQLEVPNLQAKLADLLGAKQATVNDLAVNPVSGNAYLSVHAGDSPALVRIDSSGKLTQVPLKKASYSKAVLPNPPEDRITGQGRRRRNNRDSSITDIAYIDGKVLVAGLSNSDAPSTARELAFPFADADTGTSLEIFHGAHGRYEDSAVIRTFVPFTIDGEPSLLAGFQCTPLVKFPIKALEPGKKVRGTTLAELGNRNRPLDMIVYQKDGKDYLLMANTARGVMKINTDDIGRDEGITKRISDTAGQTYETIEDWKGVVQLDRLNDNQAIIIAQTEDGSQTLKTADLP